MQLTALTLAAFTGQALAAAATTAAATSDDVVTVTTYVDDCSSTAGSNSAGAGGQSQVTGTVTVPVECTDDACAMTSAGPLTTYTTVYSTWCPNGLTAATYTVTEPCPYSTPGAPLPASHVPQGFTVVTEACTVCKAPSTAVLTKPAATPTPAPAQATGAAPAPAPAAGGSGAGPAPAPASGGAAPGAAPAPASGGGAAPAPAPAPASGSGQVVPAAGNASTGGCNGGVCSPPIHAASGAAGKFAIPAALAAVSWAVMSWALL